MIKIFEIASKNVVFRDEEISEDNFMMKRTMLIIARCTYVYEVMAVQFSHEIKVSLLFLLIAAIS